MRVGLETDTQMYVFSCVQSSAWYPQGDSKTMLREAKVLELRPLLTRSADELSAKSVSHAKD